MSWFLSLPLRFYRFFISPMIGPRCRFYPSCSQYALEALEHHGPIKGCFLSIKRVLRCHPWHPGGYDPIPGHHTECTHSHSSHS